MHAIGIDFATTLVMKTVAILIAVSICNMASTANAYLPGRRISSNVEDRRFDKVVSDTSCPDPSKKRIGDQVRFVAQINALDQVYSDENHETPVTQFGLAVSPEFASLTHPYLAVRNKKDELMVAFISPELAKYLKRDPKTLFYMKYPKPNSQFAFSNCTEFEIEEPRKLTQDEELALKRNPLPMPTDAFIHGQH